MRIPTINSDITKAVPMPMFFIGTHDIASDLSKFYLVFLIPVS